MYRRIVFLAMIFVLCISGMAAYSAPTSISYQGKLTNESGIPVRDGTYQVQFKLYTVSFKGVAFWTSDVINVQTTGGVFTTQIAPITAADLAGKTDVYLEVWTGNPLEPLAPRTRFQSVPFALEASALKLTTGAVAGNILTSDASGYGSWAKLTPASVSGQGASNGQSLMYDGTTVKWGNPTASGLLLPYIASASNSSELLNITNTGFGTAASFTSDSTAVGSYGVIGKAIGNYGIGGYFSVTNTNNWSEALRAENYGSGPAATFTIDNADNINPVMTVYTTGKGRGGVFTVNNIQSSSEALRVLTAGNGPAIKALAGLGLAGEFVGKVKMNGFQLGTTSADKSVLISDTSGNGTWGKVPTSSISSSGAFYRQTPIYDGTNVVWGYPTASGLSLPYIPNYAGVDALFQLSNTSTGRVSQFIINNVMNSNAAAYAESNGSGSAFEGKMTGSGSAITGTATGSGNAAKFTINNSTSNAKVLHVQTNGTGDAMGLFCTNTANTASGMYIEHYGTGSAIAPSALGTGSAISAFTRDGKAAQFTIASSTNNNIGVSINHSGTGTALDVVAGNGGWAGRFNATGANSNGVYISANSGKVGLNVVGGSKNAVVGTSDGARLMYTEESTEVWFTDYGFGKLENGKAVITIDPKFAESVDLSVPYHIFIQANDFDTAGLGVGNKTSTSFEVRELQGGSSNAEFSYRIVAKRKGFENDRMKRAPFADNDPNLFPR